MSPKAAFTNSHSSDVSGTAANGTAGKEDSNGDSQVGRQDEKLPQLVGGGLGVPGSKERVLHILREKGYVDVIPVVEVGAVLPCMGLDAVWLQEYPIHNSSCLQFLFDGSWICGLTSSQTYALRACSGAAGSPACIKDWHKQRYTGQSHVLLATCRLLRNQRSLNVP
jgi:hypothetical protein